VYRKTYIPYRVQNAERYYFTSGNPKPRTTADLAQRIVSGRQAARERHPRIGRKRGPRTRDRHSKAVSLVCWSALE